MQGNPGSENELKETDQEEPFVCIHVNFIKESPSVLFFRLPLSFTMKYWRKACANVQLHIIMI